MFSLYVMYSIAVLLSLHAVYSTTVMFSLYAINSTNVLLSLYVIYFNFTAFLLYLYVRHSTAVLILVCYIIIMIKLNCGGCSWPQAIPPISPTSIDTHFDYAWCSLIFCYPCMLYTLLLFCDPCMSYTLLLLCSILFCCYFRLEFSS